MGGFKSDKSILSWEKPLEKMTQKLFLDDVFWKRNVEDLTQKKNKKHVDSKNTQLTHPTIHRSNFMMQALIASEVFLFQCDQAKQAMQILQKAACCQLWFLIKAHHKESIWTVFLKCWPIIQMKRRFKFWKHAMQDIAAAKIGPPWNQPTFLEILLWWHGFLINRSVTS